METKDAKKQAKLWLSTQTGIPSDLSEHEDEAICIACAACVKEMNKNG
jgi:hypothetical protein